MSRIRRRLMRTTGWVGMSLLRPLSRSLTLGLCVTTVVAGVMPAVIAVALGRLVKASAAVAPGQGVSPVWPSLLVLLLAWFVLQATSALRNYFADAAGRRVNGALRDRVMAAVQRPETLAHLDTADVYDRITTTREIGIGGYTPGIGIVNLSDITTRRIAGVGALVLLAQLGWWTPLAVGVAWRMVRAAAIADLRTRMNLLADKAQSFRRAQYVRRLLSTPRSAREILVFGAGDFFVGLFASSTRTALAEVKSERRRLTGMLVVAGLAAVTLTVSVFAIVLDRGVSGELAIDQAVALASAVFLAASLGTVTSGDLAVEYGFASPSKIQALETEMSLLASRSPATTAPAAAHPIPAPSTIGFEGVSFTYPRGECPALSNVTFSINRGESLGVVGLNGSGKTTLIKLLCGFYGPDEGRVVIDGEDLRTFDPVAWRARVAAVFQEFSRLPISLGDNIEWANEEVAFEGVEERRRWALAAVGLEDLVDRLGDGWSTVLSRQFGGAELSGGEWQRIAIARALAATKRGAHLLILDEPTSSLDALAEAHIFDRLLEKRGDLTTILVSHRLASVRNADQIVVLEAGRIVERGTHRELMAAQGQYAMLFELQAKRFRRGLSTPGLEESSDE